MARLKINTAVILHPVKKAGVHASNTSKKAAKFFDGNPHWKSFVGLTVIIGLLIAIWGIWLALSTDVKPQVTAVIKPVGTGIIENDNGNTNREMANDNSDTNRIIQYLKTLNVRPLAPVPIIPPSPSPQATVPPAPKIISSPQTAVTAAPINIPSSRRATPPPQSANLPIVEPQFTTTTPISVESAYSAHNSQTAANELRDALRGSFSSVLGAGDESGAMVLITVEDITYPECSSTQTNCPVQVYITGRYADGTVLIPYRPFTGYEPADSFVGSDYSEAITDAVSQAYNYIQTLAQN